MTPITLHFLQASRSIRIAWLLEILEQDYTLKFADRTAAMKAPDDFKAGTGNPLGKAPSLQDSDLTVYESGAITEYVLYQAALLNKQLTTPRYLCEHYDKANDVIPKDPQEKIKVLQWIHAAEATFMLHALAITYSRWNIPKSADPSILQEVEKGLSVNVQNDLDWLEKELSQSTGKFLCGHAVTAADTMMHFSLDFILKTKLGTQGKSWPGIEKWLKACEETQTYQQAVKKTGYELSFKMPEAK
jgi:glutathione S-transferase